MKTPSSKTPPQQLELPLRQPRIAKKRRRFEFAPGFATAEDFDQFLYDSGVLRPLPGKGRKAAVK